MGNCGGNSSPGQVLIAYTMLDTADEVILDNSAGKMPHLPADGTTLIEGVIGTGGTQGGHRNRRNPEA